MSNFVESLYYQIYNKVLLGDSENAKMYLHFLREEFEKDFRQFEVLKEDHRWEHLVNLGNAIDNNLIVSNTCIQMGEKIIKENEETQVRKQDDLAKAICLEKDQLSKCLNAGQDFYCFDFEHITMFGRVDLVAKDEETIYPIELKKSNADHDVIGQIDKYIIHFKLKLINKTYRHVIGVVIANGFSEYALQQLRKIEVIAIRYKFKNDKLELIRI